MRQPAIAVTQLHRSGFRLTQAGAPKGLGTEGRSDWSPAQATEAVVNAILVGRLPARADVGRSRQAKAW